MKTPCPNEELHSRKCRPEYEFRIAIDDLLYFTIKEKQAEIFKIWNIGIKVNWSVCGACR